MLPKEYLFALRAAVQAMALLGRRLLVLAAAAVSDFYIPSISMAEHKIQSSRADPLVLQLQHVPKILKCISTQWARDGFLVSIKLETDAELLTSKAQGALINSQPKLVVGNLLPTYKDNVTLFAPDSVKEIHRVRLQLVYGALTTLKRDGEDIEAQLIQHVADSHAHFMAM